jgi:serine/threonine protein kinase
MTIPQQLTDATSWVNCWASAAFEVTGSRCPISPRVAIKILRAELARTRSSRSASAGARHTASLYHPSIVAVFDTGSTDAQRPAAILVMEYVDGVTVGQLIASTARCLRIRRSTRRRVCTALEFSTARHRARDVKPANIK